MAEVAVERKSRSAYLQEWTDRLGRFASAKQSVVDFCAKEGVTTTAFYQWKRKLAAAKDAQAEPRRKASKVDRSSGFVKRFSPGAGIIIASNKQYIAAEPLKPVILSSVEVVLPNGLLVRAGINCDATLLTQLIRSLS